MNMKLKQMRLIKPLKTPPKKRRVHNINPTANSCANKSAGFLRQDKESDCSNALCIANELDAGFGEKRPVYGARDCRRINHLIGFITAIAVLVGMLPLSVFTVSAATEWDGVSALQAGKTYTITREITLRSNLEVPAGSSLLIMKGGVLKLNNADSTYYIRGTLSAAIGGRLEVVRGTLNLTDTGALNIYGEMLLYTTGTLKLSGAFTVYNQGNLKSSGVMLIYGSGSMLIRRYAMFTKSAVITMTGSVTIDKRAELHMYGQLSVTKSGSFTDNGHMTVGRNAIIKNSGTFTVARGATLLQNGSWTDTVSGRFIDHNDGDIASKFSTAILKSEPEVVSYGIDVSHWQGEIDWNKVAQSGVEFAILRAARGNISATNPMKADDYFTRNIEGALAAGLHVGVFFYSYAYTPEEAKEEARFLLNLIKDYEIAYPVVFDMEENFAGLDKDDFTDIALAFFGEITDAGYFPMLYSNPWWISVHLDMERLEDIAFWIAEWADKPSYKGDFYIWQYSASGKVSGISTDADMNVSYRDFPAIFDKYGLNHLSGNYPVYNPPEPSDPGIVGGEEESAENPEGESGFVDADGDGIDDNSDMGGEEEELPAEEE